MTTEALKQLEEELRTVLGNLAKARTERDSLNNRVKELREAITALRAARQKINEEVKQAKARRQEKHGQAKKILETLKAMHSALRSTTGPREQAKSIEALITKLDFEYQTRPVPFPEEKKLVQRIEQLKKDLRSRLTIEKVLDQLDSLENTFEDLKDAAQKEHEEVLANAAKSDELSQAITAKFAEIDSLRNKAQKSHDNMLLLVVARDSLREKIAAERRKSLDARALAAVKAAEEREKTIKAKVNTLSATLKGKKKFNLMDLQTIEEGKGKLPF